MNLPKLVVLDRDGVINASSSVDTSPLYYVTDLDHIVIKPGAREACAIIRAHGIPIVLATKQRCIGKGIVSAERVDLINRRAERMLNIEFADILVEPEHETKRALYDRILSVYYRLNPQDMHLFDDSEDERIIAARLGFTVHDGTDLFAAVSKAFALR